MVNPEHLSIIKGKVENYEKWRMEHPDEELDLKDTDLSDTTFIFDYLERVDFAGANLERCNFNLMDLERINFTGNRVSVDGPSNLILKWSRVLKTGNLRGNLLETLQPKVPGYLYLLMRELWLRW